MNKDTMIAQLVRHEGLRQFPYRDTVGKLTIGVGRNLTDRGISMPEVHFLLSNDIEGHWDELRGRLPWVESLDETRQHVLLDMAFNLGVPGLLTFKRTLSLVKEGDYTAAAKQMLLSKWAKQVGQRARTLAMMMETGYAEAETLTRAR